MLKITSVKQITDYIIEVEFVNSVKKKLDLSILLKYPAFQFLANKDNINKIVVRGSFIEWPDFEADLSSDTILNWELKGL